MGYVIPIVMIVASNVLYNLMAKAIPGEVNPFASLVVTYLCAAALSLLLLFAGAQGKELASAFAEVNWTSCVLGGSIVFLEFGYIQAYRAGWNIGVCSLVANIALAVILLVVGVLFFRERLTLNKIVGIALCVAGLFFVNRR